MTALPLEAETLLELLNDYAVGGTTLSPGLPDYAHKERVRTALATREDWIAAEGVHLNPSRESQSSALRSMGLLDTEEYYEDRVVLLDFDVYHKDGSLKAPEAITPEQVLSRLQEEGRPLPYYWLESSTAGNFHMVWVLKDPVDRDWARPYVKSIYKYWGADPNYTNSTMRNPVHLSVVSPDKVRWWPEWSEERPLLDDPRLLLPEGELAVASSPPPHPTQSSHAETPKYHARMTVVQLEEAMATAKDGDGRWKLLTSWVRRQVMAHFQTSDTPMFSNQMGAVVFKGNSLLGTPMEPRRVGLIAHYWTPTRQRIYVARQKKAGRNNSAAKQAKEQARHEYQKVVRFRRQLEQFLRGEPTTLPADVLARDTSFEGRRLSTKGEVCYAYLAWMLDLQAKEKTNLRTGEMTEVSPANQVKNLLCNGRRAGYDEDIEERVSTTPESDAQAVALVDAILTKDRGGIRIGFTDFHKSTPVPHPKDVIYVC